MLHALLHDFAYGRPRVFAAGGYPCCCDALGSSYSSSGGFPGSLPFGSSVPGRSGCEPCINGVVALHYAVELTGIEAGETNCEDCEDLNGVYVVEMTQVGEDTCSGSIPIDGACQDDLGGVCYRRLRLVISSDNVLRVFIEPRFDGGFGECSTVAAILWEGMPPLIGGKIDCLNVSGLELPFMSQSGAIDYCNPTNAKAIVTAI